MKSPLSNHRPRTRLILGVALVFLWLYVEHRVSDMDDRFFQASLAGAKGLVLYEVGDYAGAAKAYREDLRERYRTERTAEDSIWGALLRGDYQEAAKLSTHVLEKNPSDIGSLLTLNEIALEEGAFSESISLSDRVLAIEKDQYDARLLALVAYARASRYGDAIDESRIGDAQSVEPDTSVGLL